MYETLLAPPSRHPAGPRAGRARIPGHWVPGVPNAPTPHPPAGCPGAERSGARALGHPGYWVTRILSYWAESRAVSGYPGFRGARVRVVRVGSHQTDKCNEARRIAPERSKVPEDARMCILLYDCVTKCTEVS